MNAAPGEPPSPRRDARLLEVGVDGIGGTLVEAGDVHSHSLSDEAEVGDDVPMSAANKVAVLNPGAVADLVGAASQGYVIQGASSSSHGAGGSRAPSVSAAGAVVTGGSLASRQGVTSDPAPAVASGVPKKRSSSNKLRWPPSLEPFAQGEEADDDVFMSPVGSPRTVDSAAASGGPDAASLPLWKAAGAASSFDRAVPPGPGAPRADVPRTPTVLDESWIREGPPSDDPDSGAVFGIGSTGYHPLSRQLSRDRASLVEEVAAVRRELLRQTTCSCFVRPSHA